MRLPALLLSAVMFIQIVPASLAVVQASPTSRLQVAPVPCGVETRWLTSGDEMVSRSGAHPFTFFAAAGQNCSASTILSAAYFDQDGRLVCSGTVALSIPVVSARPYRNIELQLGNVYQFMRWVNGPSRTAQQWSQLTCRTPDDETEVQPTQFARATRLHLHATTRASHGGIATASLELRLIR